MYFLMIDDVDAEMQNCEAHVESQFSGKVLKIERKLASTMLAFIVKGVATNVKCVVAAFPMAGLTSETLDVRTWKVISRLEKAGVTVLSFICDGSPFNRSFITMHTPYSKSSPGVVYDTLNFCAPDERRLFFI